MDQLPVYRVGILGAGHIAEFHLQAIRRLKHVQAVSILDLDLAAARSRAQEFSIPSATDSLDEFFAKNLNCVHVLTPPESHASLTLQALENKCHVFVEKPLASCVADCDRIIEAAQQHGRIVAVDHSLLLDPFTIRAHQLIRKGRIGQILSVELQRNQDLPPYPGGPLPDHYRLGGFPFRDLGIHSLYQIESFLGEIIDIEWSFRKQGTDWNLAFDEWRASVACETGTAHLHISWNARPLQDLITIQGTAGAITIDRFGMRVTNKRTNRLPEHPQRLFNALQEAAQTSWQVPINFAKVVSKRIRRYHGLQEMVREFYQRLAQRTPQIASADTARRITFWTEQVASAADRKKQQIESQRQQDQGPVDVLITGATGLIGREIVRQLQQEDVSIRVLVRRHIPELAQIPDLRFCYGDLGDPDAVDSAVAGAKRVIHAAGIVSGNDVEFYRGNVVATKNVVDSALRHQVEQLVYVSSLSVLHASKFNRHTSIDETWPLETRPERRGHYTKTKLTAEQIVAKAVQEKSLPAVILRPAEVVGPGAPILSSGVAQQVGHQLLILGNGQIQVPMIDVRDLANAIVSSFRARIIDGSVIHLVDDNGMTQTEIAKEYLTMTQQEQTIRHLPKAILYLAAMGFQVGFAMLRRAAPISVYRLKSALSPRTFDGRRAQTMLGWKPKIGVLQGIRDAQLQNSTHDPSIVDRTNCDVHANPSIVSNTSR